MRENVILSGLNGRTKDPFESTQKLSEEGHMHWPFLRRVTVKTFKKSHAIFLNLHFYAMFPPKVRVSKVAKLEILQTLKTVQVLRRCSKCKSI